MDILKLKFDFENAGFCRTHYKGQYNTKNYNIVIIHNKDFDEICTATKDGEPSAPLKANIKILLNNKIYITKKANEYTTIFEEVKQWKE